MPTALGIKISPYPRVVCPDVERQKTGLKGSLVQYSPLAENVNVRTKVGIPLLLSFFNLS